MILDPRLVPWNHIAPGGFASVLIALLAFFTWRKYQVFTLFLLAVVPVAGWAVSIKFLNTSLPSFPPLDAPHWAFYFSIAALPVTLLALYLGRFWWWPVVALALVGLYFGAAWIAVAKPVSTFIDTSQLVLVWTAFTLAATGVYLTLVLRPRGFGISAEYAPWLVGLTSASICLALTGTASVSFLALALIFAAIPAALVVLIRTVHGLDNHPKDRQFQAITLPIAVALPILMGSGPLYASTSWSITCLVLAAPLCGLVALRLFEIITSRRDSRNNGFGARGWKLEFIAIIVALTAAAIPATIAAVDVVRVAAEEESIY